MFYSILTLFSILYYYGQFCTALRYSIQLFFSTLFCYCILFYPTVACYCTLFNSAVFFCFALFFFFTDQCYSVLLYCVIVFHCILFYSMVFYIAVVFHFIPFDSLLLCFIPNYSRALSSWLREKIKVKWAYWCLLFFQTEQTLCCFFQRSSAWWLIEIPVVRFVIWCLILTLHYEISIAGHSNTFVWLDYAAVTAWIPFGGVYHVKCCHVPPEVHWLIVLHQSLTASDTLRRITGISDILVIMQ